MKEEKVEVIDGIKYCLDEENLTAEVIDFENKGREGAIVIPETIVFNEDSYRVTSIGEEAFSGCYSLTFVTIPDSVTSIGMYAFHLCSSLTSIIISKRVTSIGRNVFVRCSSLTSIVVAKGNTKYDSREQ